jgi:hypothetical protein
MQHPWRSSYLGLLSAVWVVSSSPLPDTSPINDFTPFETKVWGEYLKPKTIVLMSLNLLLSLILLLFASYRYYKQQNSFHFGVILSCLPLFINDIWYFAVIGLQWMPVGR